MENFTVLKEKILFFWFDRFIFLTQFRKGAWGRIRFVPKKNGFIELTNGVEQVHEEEDEGHPEGGHAHEHEPLPH